MLLSANKPRQRNHGFVSKAAIHLLAGGVFTTLLGCSVQSHKTGQAENVQVRTPLGGLSVRTNSVHGPDVGLPIYPGATETTDHGEDSGSADVALNFGKWRLTVKAVEYQSNDPEEKLIAFYKKAMSQYGDVLTCKDKVAIGKPSRTAQGLTCANDHEYDVRVKTDRATISTSNQPVTGNIKLLSGSPGNQHIVEFKPESNRTRFSMVVVQFPHKDQTD
jgi:hypothetical protein